MDFVRTVMGEASALQAKVASLQLENAVMRFEGVKLVAELAAKDAELSSLRARVDVSTGLVSNGGGEIEIIMILCVDL